MPLTIRNPEVAQNARLILINLDPNEYSQELHYYPFTAKLGRCNGSCNTLNDLSNKVCVPNKTEDLNLNLFNMIPGINESKPLTKHISCKFICKFDGKNIIQINGGITINFDVSVKNVMYVKKIYVTIKDSKYVKTNSVNSLYIIS